MILRFEMILSVVSYERNNIIFHEKSLKLPKNNNFNNVFCNRIFLHYLLTKFLEFFMKPFFWKIFYTTLVFPISKVKYSVAEIDERIFFKETFSFFPITIFEDFLLTFEIGNSRVVENILPKK